MVIKTIEKNESFGEEDNFRIIKEDLTETVTFEIGHKGGEGSKS